MISSGWTFIHRHLALPAAIRWHDVSARRKINQVKFFRTPRILIGLGISNINIKQCKYDEY